MRKVVVNAFVSLDGVVQAPGGPDEDLDGGFTQGGWSVTYWDDVMGAAMDAFMGEPFDLLLGRRTYDIFAAHWPTAADEDGAGPLNAATKYVASRGKPALEWQESVLLEVDADGDAAPAVAQLKATPGRPLQVHGSANFLQSLLRRGLVDELQVLTFPVIIGSGKRFFTDRFPPTALELVTSQTSGTGVLIATYRPAGELVTGSF